MAYFPFFIDIEGKNCLIAGGGKVACRKIRVLKEYSPCMKVIASRVSDELWEMKNETGIKMEIEERTVIREDLDNQDFVIAATDDEKMNQQLVRWCREKRILVNRADEMDEEGFIFPAVVKRGDITVGISTGGASPALAGHLKEGIKNALPDYLAELASFLKAYRKILREKLPDSRMRQEILRELAKTGIDKRRCPDEGEIREIEEIKISKRGKNEPDN